MNERKLYSLPVRVYQLSLPDTADVQAEGRTCKLFAKSNTVILA